MAGYDFETIKALARRLGWSVDDLIALAEENDPFFCGRPSHRAAGEWFASLWQRFRFGHGVHLRRIHYVLVSQEPAVLLPDSTARRGVPYRNTLECWKLLTQASKVARYLGLVPLDAFVDRRNPEPMLFAPEPAERLSCDDKFLPYTVSGSLAAVSLPHPDSSLPGYWTTGAVEQRYHVEVWCEKSTMNDILIPLCRSTGVNLITGLGEMSIPAVRNLILRIAETAKPARLLYVSDFDPGGQSMPRAVSRKAEWLIAHDDLDVDLRLFPIVLTAAQVEKYRLPRTPIKETERRRATFEERHGEGAVELDALEALRPGEFRRIVEEAIGRYRDNTLQHRFEMARAQVIAVLDPIEREILAEHADSIELLRADHEAIGERLAAWQELAEQLQETIEADLSDRIPKISAPVPEPAVADEPEALFDSRRSYEEQLFAYKRHRNGHGHDDLVEDLRLRQLIEARGRLRDGEA